MDHKCNKSGNCLKRRGCSPKYDQKLNVYNWLSDLPDSEQNCDFVEVQFKNTRKDYYKNSLNLPLEKGDIVAVESSIGHDIGTVTLTGRLVLIQMKKANVKVDPIDIKRVYRKAKPSDMERFHEAKSREHDTMLRSRIIAEGLMLNMKIGDVEYQGDGAKAIFYYIADDRVDFRQLIKVLAEQFGVKIEMKQIGARQEAGRIGGIGPCGRQLCCAGFLTHFSSVSTSAARFQDISMNPQKLAGQCAKLKCCFNFEVDTYVEAHKGMPSREINLETERATYYHFKSDVLEKKLSYSTVRNAPINLVTLSPAQVFSVIEQNKKGIRPAELTIQIDEPIDPTTDFHDGVGDESLTRFDAAKRKNNKSKRKSPTNRTQLDRPIIETSKKEAPHNEQPKSDVPKIENPKKIEFRAPQKMDSAPSTEETDTASSNNRNRGRNRNRNRNGQNNNSNES